MFSCGAYHVHFIPRTPFNVVVQICNFRLWKRTFTCKTLNGARGRWKDDWKQSPTLNGVRGRWAKIWEQTKKPLQEVKSFFLLILMYNIYHHRLMLQKKTFDFLQRSVTCSIAPTRRKGAPWAIPPCKNAFFMKNHMRWNRFFGSLQILGSFFRTG